MGNSSGRSCARGHPGPDGCARTLPWCLQDPSSSLGAGGAPQGEPGPLETKLHPGSLLPLLCEVQPRFSRVIISLEKVWLCLSSQNSSAEQTRCAGDGTAGEGGDTNLLPGVLGQSRVLARGWWLAALPVPSVPSAVGAACWGTAATVPLPVPVGQSDRGAATSAPLF